MNLPFAGRPLTPQERSFAPLPEGGPLVVDSDGITDLARLCATHRAPLRQALVTHGALLFRGFGVADTAAFRAAVDALGIEPSPFPYAGNTLRPPTGPAVYDVTAAPAWTSIFPHNEMFYWHRQPRFISFWCERSEGAHGETPLVDCRGVWADLPVPLQERLRTARFFVVSRYASELEGERNPLSQGTQLANTWQAVAGTSDPRAFEAQLAPAGASVSWHRKGAARVKVENALVVAHPDTAEPCFRGLGLLPVQTTRRYNRGIVHRLPWGGRWRNRALDLVLWLGARLQRRIGLSQGRFSHSELDAMAEAVWRRSTFFRWQVGDVLVVDNLSTGHGRLDVDGPRRLHVTLGGGH